jgi:DNA-binding transcriptional MerR regulator
MEKLFWTIGEVAEILGENVSLVRYWTNRFTKLLKPSRTSKGSRRYTAEEIETLKQLHYLIKTKGLSLDGAEMQIISDNSKVSYRVKALDSLKEIRTQLIEIKKNL